MHQNAPKLDNRNWKFEIGEGKSSRGLGETVVSLAEEGEEAEVAKDLELLADFVADGAKGRGKGQKPQRSKPKAAAPGCEFTARRVAWYATSIRAPRA